MKDKLKTRHVLIHCELCGGFMENKEIGLNEAYTDGEHSNIHDCIRALKYTIHLLAEAARPDDYPTL